ncbi:MAG: acyl carrier protein [Ramlibacter sp.]|nr:acyl carrier protein [Ramlibacter sp.]
MTLKKLIADVLRVDEAEITEESSAKTLKAWNSSRHVELVMAIEKRYQIQFGGAEIVALQSFRQIREMLAKKDIVV